MQITIITFYIALAGIVLMLILKAREVKTGKASILRRISKRIDHIFDAMYDKTKYAVSHVNRHTVIGLAQVCAFHVLSTLRANYIWLYRLAHRNPHAKMVIDMVRGRGERNFIGKMGENIKPSAASFFLKRISEDKMVAQRGGQVAHVGKN